MLTFPQIFRFLFRFAKHLKELYNLNINTKLIYLSLIVVHFGTVSLQTNYLKLLKTILQFSQGLNYLRIFFKILGQV